MEKDYVDVFMVFEGKPVRFGDHKKISLKNLYPRKDWTLIPLRVPFEQIKEVWETDDMIPANGEPSFKQTFVTFKNGERWEILDCSLKYAKAALEKKEKSMEERVLTLEKNYAALLKKHNQGVVDDPYPYYGNCSEARLKRLERKFEEHIRK